MKYGFILILLLCNSAKAQVQPNGGDNYSFDGKVFLLKEGYKPMSVSEAWVHFTKKQFQPVASPKNEVELGFVKDIYWLALPIKNTHAYPLNLLAGIDNGGIFRLEYYQLKNDGTVVFDRVTGSNYDFDSRAIKNRRYYFPFILPKFEEGTIFFRVDMRGNEFHIPLRLITKEYLAQTDAQVNMIYAFVSGLLLLVIFLSLVTYLWTKERLYLFYLLYVASYYMFFVGDSNYDVPLLYPHSPFMATISPTIYALLTSTFTLVFMNEFLQLKATHKLLFKLSKLLIYLLLGAIVMLPAAYVFSTNIIFRIFVFIYCLVAVSGTWLVQGYCIARRIKDKFKPAYLYALALGFVLMCAIAYVLRVLTIIPDLVPTFVYLPIGFGCEIITLSFALIYNYSLYKNKSQQLSLDLANQQLDFSNQLLLAQQMEQKRIAEDLHDELGGNLAAIKMNLQRLDMEHENLDTVIQLIDKASGNARNIAHNLMPPEFEETKLEDLLQNFYNRLNREGNIRFDFIVSGTDGHFDKQQSLIIYRVLLELTNNIIKHSSASKATIQLVNDKGCLEIMAEDNGKGFAENKEHGIGLKNIQSRVGFLKGDMNIDSGVGGTTIIVRIPYKQ